MQGSSKMHLNQDRPEHQCRSHRFLKHLGHQERLRMENRSFPLSSSSSGPIDQCCEHCSASQNSMLLLLKQSQVSLTKDRNTIRTLDGFVVDVEEKSGNARGIGA